MKTIKGQKFLTLSVKPDEIYKVEYRAAEKICIMNLTEGDLRISIRERPENVTEDNAGQYLVLRRETAANSIEIPFGEVYIEAENTGLVTIERCI